MITVINVSKVINSSYFRQTYTVTRTNGKFVKGKFILGNAECFDITGIVVPASAKEVKMIPEGDRIDSMMMFYSLVPLYVTHTNLNGIQGISDIITWHGNKYKIMQVNPYIDYGYYQAIGVRMEGY